MSFHVGRRGALIAGAVGGVIGLGAYLAAASGLAEGGCEPDLTRFVVPGCAISANDTGKAQAARLWGRIQCEASSRVQRVRAGGDTWPRATGVAQSNRSFRRLELRRGDDFYGSRCELGRNERRHGTQRRSGTFALYREGERRITLLSLRLPRSFPLRTPRWQTVMQMKQTQPYADAGGRGPALELQVRKRALHLYSSWRHLWRTRIKRRLWTRIALDVTYSSDPRRGSVRVYVSGKHTRRSPTFRVATLRRERTGSDGLPAGASIPSHLRVGLYRDSEARCPRGRCVVHIDNVQVTAPIDG